MDIRNKWGSPDYRGTIARLISSGKIVQVNLFWKLGYSIEINWEKRAWLPSFNQRDVNVLPGDLCWQVSTWCYEPVTFILYTSSQVINPSELKIVQLLGEFQSCFMYYKVIHELFTGGDLVEITLNVMSPRWHQYNDDDLHGQNKGDIYKQ